MQNIPATLCQPDLAASVPGTPTNHADVNKYLKFY